MLRLYCSNRTESLAKVVAAIMRAQPLKQVFGREQVIIQSQGMGTWLNQFLSKELGIVAGLETHMPASFVWRIARNVLETKRANPQFDKVVLRWEIYQRLPSLLDQLEFQSLKRYLDGLSQNSDGTRPGIEISHTDLYELSTQLADCLDAYQNYRHEWLQAWDRGESAVANYGPTLAEMEQWQAELWRQLYPQLSREQRLHRPEQLSALTQALASIRDGQDSQSEQAQAALPERLFVFGLSSFPPQWLELLEHLGKHIDVHFLIQNPCRYYWGDVQTHAQQLRLQQSLIDKGVSSETAAEMFVESNPLLASWGRLGRDYISALLEVSDHGTSRETEVIEIYDDWGEASALKCLQQDILDLNSQQRVVSLDDDSIRFASCHSRLRELEGLKDYVLAALDGNDQLECSDIIVMMPNVQDYAPLITAVFSEAVLNEEGLSQTLSYSVSDQSVRHHQPLLECFIELLQLPQSRLTASEVMSWLELDAIRERFGFQTEDLPQIREWIEALNLRWGLSAKHKQNVLGVGVGAAAGASAPASAAGSEGAAANTWQRARQRLLAGLVYGDGQILSDELEAFRSFEVSSTEAQSMIAKLIGCLDVLEWSLAEMSVSRNGSEWASFVAEFKNAWIHPEHAPEQFESNLMRALEDLENQFSTAEFDQAVPFSVVSKALTTQLEQERVSQRFLAGSINFCTLMPMRSIPFKVVCLLGMNDGEYPRTVHGNSFDLLSMTPAQKGDRSRREDDRYLFLEALLSVRERLYVSYIGRDAQDNSERFPSVLVSELRECIDSTFQFEASEDSALNPLSRWTTEHRLQAFHPRYYSEPDDKEATSYESRWLALYQQNSGQDNRDQENSRASDKNDPGEAVSIDTSSLLTKTAVEADDPLRLSDIARVFRHPLKSYYQKALGLSAPSVAEPLEEDEPFAADGLGLYKLKEELLATRLKHTLGMNSEQIEDAQDWQAELKTLQRHWQLSESLPVAPLDQFEMMQAVASSQPFDTKLESLDGIEWLETELGIDLSHLDFKSETLESITVSANFAFDHQQVQILLSASTNVAKRFWSDWAMHVFWNVARPGKPTRLITPETELWFPGLSDQEAKHFAAEVVDLYFHCLKKPVCLLPQSAFVSVFHEDKLPSIYWGAGAGTSAQAGEAADYYFERAQSSSTNLSEHEHWLRRSDGADNAYVLPNFEHLSIYQQVLKHQDQIGDGPELEGLA